MERKDYWELAQDEPEVVKAAKAMRTADRKDSEAGQKPEAQELHRRAMEARSRYGWLHYDAAVRLAKADGPVALVWALSRCPHVPPQTLFSALCDGLLAVDERIAALEQMLGALTGEPHPDRMPNTGCEQVSLAQREP